MSPILQRLMSVFISACRLLSALPSLLQFGQGRLSHFTLCAVTTFWAMSLVRIYPGRALIKWQLNFAILVDGIIFALHSVQLPVLISDYCPSSLGGKIYPLFVLSLPFINQK